MKILDDWSKMHEMASSKVRERHENDKRWLSFAGPSPEFPLVDDMTASDSRKKEVFNFVKIRIAGLEFKTLDETLRRYPDTLLGSDRREDFFCADSGAYNFVERCQQSFHNILYFYQSRGILVCPKNVDLSVFKQELIFFGIPFIDPDNLVTAPVNQPPQDQRFKSKIKRLLTSGDTCRSGKVIIACLDVSFTLAYTAVLCTSTLPEKRRSKLFDYISHCVEFVALSWFVIHYVSRLVFSKSRYSYIFSFMPIIDCLVILSVILDYTLKYRHVLDVKDGPKAFDIIGCFRVVAGLFRLFNIARYSLLLFCLGVALGKSFWDLLHIICLIAMVIFVFSSLVFFLEEDSHSKVITFHSVFDAIWWGCITITTVGYGDLVPTKTAAKVVGAMLALSGLPIIAIPMPLIMAKFDTVYDRLCDDKKNKDREAYRKNQENLQATTRLDQTQRKSDNGGPAVAKSNDGTPTLLRSKSEQAHNEHYFGAIQRPNHTYRRMSSASMEYSGLITSQSNPAGAAELWTNTAISKKKLEEACHHKTWNEHLYSNAHPETSHNYDFVRLQINEELDMELEAGSINSDSVG